MSKKYSRRTFFTFFIKVTPIIFGVQIFSSNLVQAAGEHEVDIEWRVFPDQIETLKSVAKVEEADTYDTRSPIVVGAIVLVGALILPKVSQAIFDVYHRYKSGGVIIDVRSQPVIIETNTRIPAGFALIISNDDTYTVELGGVPPLKAEDLSVLIKSTLK